jgi:hypothetical protein
MRPESVGDDFQRDGKRTSTRVPDRMRNPSAPNAQNTATDVVAPATKHAAPANPPTAPAQRSFLPIGLTASHFCMRAVYPVRVRATAYPA